ncbi:MAG: transglycosylase domain-containing protein [Thermomicrobiales bacterium]
MFSVALAFLSFVAALAGGLGIWVYFSADLPDLNSVEARQFETTRIYDRNWNLLYEVNDPLTGSGPTARLTTSPPTVRTWHSWTRPSPPKTGPSGRTYGVDPIAIVRGVYITLTGDGRSGGSTITQQLVRQLYPDTIGYERSLDRSSARRRSRPSSPRRTARKRSSNCTSTRSTTEIEPTASMPQREPISTSNLLT